MKMVHQHYIITDIKKDVEKLKEKFRLLHGYNKNVTVMIFIN